jgi:hypothetical protein
LIPDAAPGGTCGIKSDPQPVSPAAVPGKPLGRDQGGDPCRSRRKCPSLPGGRGGTCVTSVLSRRLRFDSRGIQGRSGSLSRLPKRGREGRSESEPALPTNPTPQKGQRLPRRPRNSTAKSRNPSPGWSAVDARLVTALVDAARMARSLIPVARMADPDRVPVDS